jgi:hypothetical protein
MNFSLCNWGEVDVAMAVNDIAAGHKTVGHFVMVNAMAEALAQEGERIRDGRLDAAAVLEPSATASGGGNRMELRNGAGRRRGAD